MQAGGGRAVAGFKGSKQNAWVVWGFPLDGRDAIEAGQLRNVKMRSESRSCFRQTKGRCIVSQWPRSVTGLLRGE